MIKNIYFAVLSLTMLIFISCDGITGIFDAAGGAQDSQCLLDQDTLFKGYAISPQGHPTDFSDIPNFYNFSQSFSQSSVMIASNWRDSFENSGQVPEGFLNFKQASSQYCFNPVWVTGWRSDDELSLDHPMDASNISWTNNFTQTAFETMVIDFVTQAQPPYFFLSNEDNFYFEEDPIDHQNWVTFYEALYDLIKAASPNTKVGITFNYEHISGKGVLNGWNANNWEALERYNPDKVDVYGFTIYPFFSQVNVQGIQNNYLDDLFAKVGSKPIAITETGWPARAFADYPTLWTANETQQALYATKILSLIQDRNVELIHWLYLHPLQDFCNGCDKWKLFGSVSLFDEEGNPRQAYEKWIDPLQE